MSARSRPEKSLSALAAALILCVLASACESVKTSPADERRIAELERRVRGIEEKFARLGAPFGSSRQAGAEEPSGGMSEREGFVQVYRYAAEDRDGVFELSGKVRNAGNVRATDVQIVMRTYTEDGAPADLFSTWGRPPRLAPGDVATFYKTIDRRGVKRAEMSVRWLVGGREYRSEKTERVTINF